MHSADVLAPRLRHLMACINVLVIKLLHRRHYLPDCLVLYCACLAHGDPMESGRTV